MKSAASFTQVRLLNKFPKFLFSGPLDIKGDNILMTGAPPEPDQTTIQLSMDDLMSSTFKLTDFGAGMLQFILSDFSSENYSQENGKSIRASHPTSRSSRPRSYYRS
jgi:hypothetical protein